MTSYKTIEANELHEMLAGEPFQLIDVRNDNEVATGIIPGASHVPLAMVPGVQDQFERDIALVFYCHSGIRSAQAAAYLASLGHDEVYNLQGGVLAWGRAGYEFAAK